MDSGDGGHSRTNIESVKRMLITVYCNSRS